MNARGTLTGGTSSEGRVSGYVFKIVRESTGRTQQQLAADLRVSAATIQGWESGRRPLMAMPAGQFLALRSRLSHLGATAALLRDTHPGPRSRPHSRPRARHPPWCRRP